MNGKIDKRKDMIYKQIDKDIDSRKDKWTERQINGKIRYRLTEKQIDGMIYMYVIVDGKIRYIDIYIDR